MKLRGNPHLLDVIEEEEPPKKLTADDKHTWVKDSLYKDNTFKEKHVCSICRCERLTSFYGRYRDYFYIRDGIMLPKRPDCINWAKENLKTID